MSIALTPLLATARIPLFAVAPDRWEGSAFIGEVGARHEGISTAHLVQFVYLDDIDGTTMGAQVSNLDPVAHAADPIRDHVTRFVARFDAAAAVPHGMFRKRLPFALGEFSRKELTLPVAGETRGAVVLTHRTMPLQLARTAVRRGSHATDLGIATWRLDVREFAAKVEGVDAPFAAVWDARQAEVPTPAEDA